MATAPPAAWVVGSLTKVQVRALWLGVCWPLNLASDGCAMGVAQGPVRGSEGPVERVNVPPY